MIKTIGVIGAGQMGAQIAVQAALHGFPVALHDLSAEQPGKLEEMVALWNEYKKDNGVLDVPSPVK